MSAGMQRFLDKMISDAEKNVARVQIIFVPGTGASAGGLTKVEGFEDLYELVTFVAPQGVNPATLKEEDLQTVSMFFESDAVQRVMQEKNVDSQIIAPGGGLVTPRH